MKNRVSIRENIANMERTVARSHMLWLHVNRFILRVLKSKQSRAKMATRLEACATPRKRNDPTSFSNFLVAARQIRNGEKVVVL